MLVLVASCAADQASDSVTDVVRWFWRNHDTASSAQVGDAVVGLDGNVTAVTADAPIKEIVSSLLTADVAWTGRTDVNPALATGMLVVSELGCTLDQVLHLHTAANQASLHPGTYTSFARTFVQNRDDFLSHAIDRLDWITEEATPHAGISTTGSIPR